MRDRKAGKQRRYGLDARGLRPVHDGQQTLSKLAAYATRVFRKGAES